MKISQKEKLAIVLVKGPLKGGEIKTALKEQFKYDAASGDISRLILGSPELFKVEGELRHYTYSLTPAGQDAARTAKAMANADGAPMPEATPTKQTPGSTTASLADLAVAVLLDNDNTPMGPTEIATAIENKYHKGASVQVVNAALSGGINKKNPTIIRTGHGKYQALVGPTEGLTEGSITEVEPKRYTKSQWTLTLVNGTQQFAANISAASAKRIVNTVLFKSDSEELN